MDCLIKELGIDNLLGNPIYTPTIITKEEIVSNHMSVLYSSGISTKDEELDLPSLYWIPKLHRYPYKQRYIAGSAKCFTKYISKFFIVYNVFFQGENPGFRITVTLATQGLEESDVDSEDL